MGMNTVVVMMNDETHKWPSEMVRAMQARDFRPLGSHFPGGKVISTGHSSDIQIVAAGGNTGALLSPIDAARPEHLEALSEILRAHGYSVKAPGAKRAKGPLDWGYAAREARKAREEAASSFEDRG